jgi:hypothetical protein
MNDQRRSPGSDGETGVGYASPPRETRFQPGRSGNPKGRPKKKRTIDAMLQDALSRPVYLQEGGKKRKLTAQEAIILRLVSDATRDPRALKILLPMIERYGGTSATSIDMKELVREDQELLEAYLKKQQRNGAFLSEGPSEQTEPTDPSATRADE